MDIAISKGHYISVAHRLMNHPGKCKNLHGHNYKIVYHFTCDDYSKVYDKTGMVMDFGDIKSKVIKEIEDAFDHKTILQDTDPLLEVLKQNGVSVIPFVFPPTAENMAASIYTYVNNSILKEYKGDVKCFLVEVWETETSRAVACFNRDEFDQMLEETME